ncbi:uncharacterized protein A1O9_11537 [Exophiala aquamarina CBS 119918]|uniref:Uncharacterized protein n=1 Tax=Exophiala aquamarina CBS 119918 TaxID=1182545 RepID=A0A072NY27_9EURO|nr:uncharacterized protein A1O9_11537 [Exophiala aquamarina CBS 119918]KEF52297.1 hypothetical protein A1O9_11537 [Exophiala aquamarina CBS 119918]
MAGAAFLLGNAEEVGNIQDGVGAGIDLYKLYTGDGSAAAGWPTKDQWVSFEDMFNANRAMMRASCVNLGADCGANNSGEEIDQIWNAIQFVAHLAGVDHRFILAVMLQESKGCVRVRTTGSGLANPGLRQSHNGQYSCNQNSVVLNPCPGSHIFGMIHEGVRGTMDGDGIAGVLNKVATCDDAGQYISGSIPDETRLEIAGLSTACYASDIANRLTGWVVAPSQCHF